MNENKKLEFHNNIKFKNPSFKSYISQNEKYKKKISNNRIQMKVSFRTNKKNSSHSLFSKKSIKNKNLIEEEYDLKSDIDKRSFFLFKSQNYLKDGISFTLKATSWLIPICSARPLKPLRPKA